jgi:hypothetical protein
VVGALALAACAPAETPSTAPPEPISRVRSYRYDGVAGASRVTLERAPSGQESLVGRTEVARDSAPVSRTVMNETATLDARGRLHHAEVVVSTPGAPEARYTLDAHRGTVHVERAGSAPVDWRVPVDAPWLYAPAASGHSDLVLTPVAAWVALQASRAAGEPTGGRVVRVVEPERHNSYLMTIDQVAVPTERGTTVALGYDGVDVDDQFVTELRLLEGSVILARRADADLGA